MDLRPPGPAVPRSRTNCLLCRLYLGLSKLDPATADELRKNTTVQKIRAYAHVLDFYGGMFQVRNGHAIVPGGPHNEKVWA